MYDWLHGCFAVNQNKFLPSWARKGKKDGSWLSLHGSQLFWFDVKLTAASVEHDTFHGNTMQSTLHICTTEVMALYSDERSAKIMGGDDRETKANIARQKSPDRSHSYSTGLERSVKMLWNCCQYETLCSKKAGLHWVYLHHWSAGEPFAIPLTSTKYKQ